MPCLSGVAILMALGVTAPTAFGQAVSLSAGPIYSSPLIKGTNNVAATFTMTNNSSGPITIDTSAANHRIRYVPACRDSTFQGVPFPVLMCFNAGDQDPGVFTVNAAGIGNASPDTVGVSGCNGTAFTFTGTADAAGTVEITSAAPIVLPLGYTCNIAFTLNVVAVPTHDSDLVTNGVQTLGLGQVIQAALVSNTSITGNGSGSSGTTVFECSPAPNTQCRAAGANATCDPAENCNTTGPLTGYCPADSKAASGTTCGVGTVCTLDQCNGAGACLPVNLPNTTTCRAAGANATCDPAELCLNGVCPANSFTAAGTSCGPGTTCTLDQCNGSGACSPVNKPDTTVCRAAGANATCDPAELCTAGVCPADSKAPNGTACGDPSTTVCDNPDSCLNGVCAVNNVANGTQCRAGDPATCNPAELCASGVCPADQINPTCHPAFCRSVGFFAEHAGTEKKNSTNITQGLITLGGGSLNICGKVLNNTNVSSPTSALEALCEGGGGVGQLARQLTALALGCIGTIDTPGQGANCVNTPFAALFATCNAACAANTVGTCIDQIDCLNNGGTPVVNGNNVACTYSGVCSNNAALACTNINASSVCGPLNHCNLAPTCHDTALPAPFTDGPAGSSGACNDARKSKCDIFGNGCV